MLIKRFAGYIMRGRLEAYMLAFVFAFLPLMGWLAGTILALVTLRLGALEGLGVLLVSSIPACIYLLFGKTLPLYTEVFGGLVVVYVLAIFLKTTRSWNTVIQIAALIAMIAVFSVHMFFPNITDYWTATLTQYFKTAENLTALELNQQDFNQLIWLLAQIATGTIAVWLMLVNLINLGIGRWFQAELYYPQGLPKELLSIRLGWPANLMLIVVAAAVLFKLPSSLEYVPIVIGMFFAAGISLIHASLQKNRYATLIIILFYGLLIFQAKIIIPFTAVFALIDSWFNLRKHL